MTNFLQFRSTTKLRRNKDTDDKSPSLQNVMYWFRCHPVLCCTTFLSLVCVFVYVTVIQEEVVPLRTLQWSTTSSSSGVVTLTSSKFPAYNPNPAVQVLTVNALRGSEHHDTIHTTSDISADVTTIVTHEDDIENYHPDECRWYLAESAIPQSGLGLFTARGLHKDDMIGFPDICIFVSDPPEHWTHLRSHSWGLGKYFGQYETKTNRNRAACEGFTTTYNTVPDAMVNTDIVSPVVQTNGGLHRGYSPGAGSTTHHYGIHAKAKDVITAGSELTIRYGDWHFKSGKTYPKPERPVDWLQQHGWCIDNIEIKRSTIPHAGRGAFARVPLQRGQVIAPAPLQMFENRNVFATTVPEQLIVNYCLQPSNSDMIMYPYGPAVNLINHNRVTPNVQWQWSTHEKNTLHHSAWLDLSYEEFWKVASPGGLILEIVALRDIKQGEELVLDYGMAWETAWQQHVQTWHPIVDAEKYVYPADMDETVPLRTYKEQQINPYPSNLITMCSTPDWDRKQTKHITWYENTKYKWQELNTYCQIIDRVWDKYTTQYNYTASIIFGYNDVTNKIDTFDPTTVPLEDQYIDYNVPRRAIRFIEKPYVDDEHLPNAFRHPIELPAYLTPQAWLRPTDA